MAAYIVGLIVGSITTVFPLIYLMNYDRSIARILARQPDFAVSGFPSAVSPFLITSITVIGAVVLLASTAMAAISGMKQIKKSTRSAAQLSDDGRPYEEEETEL